MDNGPQLVLILCLRPGFAAMNAFHYVSFFSKHNETYISANQPHLVYLFDTLENKHKYA